MLITRINIDHNILVMFSILLFAKKLFLPRCLWSVFHFQMETGDLGLLLQHVVSLVEVEPKWEHETVILLLPQMEALLVLGWQMKVSLATMQHVLSVSITQHFKVTLTRIMLWINLALSVFLSAISNTIFKCYNKLQMEIGEFGVLGQIVVLLVVVGPSLEHETVTLLLPQMVVWSVVDQELKIRHATLQHVQSVSIFDSQEGYSHLRIYYEKTFSKL